MVITVSIVLMVDGIQLKRFGLGKRSLGGENNGNNGDSEELLKIKGFVSMSGRTKKKEIRNFYSIFDLRTSRFSMTLPLTVCR